MKETIAAIATASGRGGVAVVRVSGDGAFGVLRSLARCEPRPGRICVRRILGEECVVLAFQAPHSYTGEDVAEFQCHGGLVAPRRILDAALRNGARLARRGEFTERAFLNGRIGYEAAEAVIDLIDAKTDKAAEAALQGLDGASRRAVREQYDAALEISAQIEHSLDIDEGELPPGFEDGVMRRIAAFAKALDAAAAALRRRAIMRHGALVVLAGAPNTGKSSLFNALVEESRAIVSATAGTTRDAIEAWLDIDGWPVRLVDTAGLRETADMIEAEGVKRSEDFIARAAVVIALDDTCAGALGGACRAIRVNAKCDIAGEKDGLNVSAVTGKGVDELRSAIAAQLEAMAEAGDGAPCQDSAERDLASLLEARAAAATALETGAAGDLVLAGNAMRRAATILGECVGAEYSADMLERLFSRFCVGK